MKMACPRKGLARSGGAGAPAKHKRVDANYWLFACLFEGQSGISLTFDLSFRTLAHAVPRATAKLWPESQGGESGRRRQHAPTASVSFWLRCPDRPNVLHSLSWERPLGRQNGSSLSSRAW
jgi:hypothetical protein